MRSICNTNIIRMYPVFKDFGMKPYGQLEKVNINVGTIHVIENVLNKAKHADLLNDIIDFCFAYDFVVILKRKKTLVASYQCGYNLHKVQDRDWKKAN